MAKKRDDKTEYVPALRGLDRKKTYAPDPKPVSKTKPKR